MRLFRAVRAVGLSLCTCVRCAPVYAPFTRRVAVYAARLSGFGGAVRWFAGCAAVTSLQYFPTPTLSPPRVFAGVLYWKRSHTG